MKIAVVLLLSILTQSVFAQNLFPVKLNNCNTERFCLDCGDIQGGFDKNQFEEMLAEVKSKLNLNGVKGAVYFQVLIDYKGKGCVLSHTDESNNPITKTLIKSLNKFNGWTPASTDGKLEDKTSVNLIVEIKDGNLFGVVDRVDMNAFKKSFDHPISPEIFNKTYAYKNEHLSNYNISVWNSGNSNLKNNMNDHITIDKNGVVWLTVDEGLVTFDGKDFKDAEQNITPRGDYFNYFALATDNNNIKWVYGTKNIYSFDDTKWTKYDPAVIGIDGAYEIVNNPKTGEVFFCSDEGLTIFKDGKWTNINKNTFKDLPSNRVTFAKRDSKNRIWIGTFSGSAMIDENNQLTSFENKETVLNGKCITSMDEDENGNLYFSLFEFGDKEKGKINNDEGIAIYYADGTLKQFTTENSGIPFNHTNCVLYDKVEKVLWISTDRAGLVRYDLKDGWENYHNENSAIPTAYISTMTFDNQGNLFLATRQGLVKVERK
ncbi:Two component regulator propeller [compost metagenome]